MYLHRVRAAIRAGLALGGVLYPLVGGNSVDRDVLPLLKHENRPGRPRLCPRTPGLQRKGRLIGGPSLRESTLSLGEQHFAS
jgi:hypothetical protein